MSDIKQYDNKFNINDEVFQFMKRVKIGVQIKLVGLYFAKMMITEEAMKDIKLKIIEYMQAVKLNI